MSEPLPLKVKLGDDVICQPLQDEIVLLKQSSQYYFGLDEVGAHAWGLLVDDGDVATVAERLCEAYEGDPAIIRSDFYALVGELIEAGLLRRA